MYWSREEVRYYYELMKQQSSKQETINDENVLLEKMLKWTWIILVAIRSNIQSS